MGVESGRGSARGPPAATAPWPSGRLRPAFRRPSGRVSCRRSSSSPAELAVELLRRRRHTLDDGLAHPRNRDQEQGLLDGTPVVLAHKHGIAALAGDLDRLVRVGHIVHQLVELLTRLGRGDSSHCEVFLCTYGLAYARRNDASSRRRGGALGGRRDRVGQTYSNGRGERIRAETPSPILLIPVTNVPTYVGRVWKTA